MPCAHEPAGCAEAGQRDSGELQYREAVLGLEGRCGVFDGGYCRCQPEGCEYVEGADQQDECEYPHEVVGVGVWVGGSLEGPASGRPDLLPLELHTKVHILLLTCRLSAHSTGLAFTIQLDSISCWQVVVYHHL